MGRILRSVFVPFIVLLYAISGGGDYPQQVTGLIGGTVELVFRQNFTHFAKEIVLKFKRESKTLKIAEYKNITLEIEHPQFQNRLEMFKNGMGLRIKNVSFEDSGMYIAEITLKNNTVHKKSFNLSLYDPVPDPFIRIDNDRDTCNVTLHCYVRENATSLSYLWKYSINGSDFQPHNSTSATIQVSLQQGSSYIKFLCTVRNPADQKNVSHAFKSCQHKETHRYWLWWLSPTTLVILLTAAFIFRAVFQTCRKKEPRLSVPETDKNPEYHVPFPVSKSGVTYSKFVVSIHEEKLLNSSCKMDLGDSEHPFISPDPEDSENKGEC